MWTAGFHVQRKASVEVLELKLEVSELKPVIPKKTILKQNVLKSCSQPPSVREVILLSQCFRAPSPGQAFGLRGLDF